MDKKYRPVCLVFYPEDDERLNEIAAQMGELVGGEPIKRSEVVRRLIRAFNVEEWAASLTKRNAA